MRRRKGYAYLLPALALLLLLSQGFMGAVYAAWQDQTNLFARLDTGRFAVSFLDEECRAYLIGRGQPQHRAQPLGLSCQLSGDRKSIALTLTDDDLAALLAGEDQLLLIRCPLGADAESSVTQAAPRAADLSGEPDARIQMEGTPPILIVAGEQYALPGWADSIRESLYFDVYHALEQSGAEMTGLVYLALDAESRAYLRAEKALQVEFSELPPALAALLCPLGDGSRGVLRGELQINYHCTLPLAVQQGSGGAGEGG